MKFFQLKFIDYEFPFNFTCIFVKWYKKTIVTIQKNFYKKKPTKKTRQSKIETEII